LGKISSVRKEAAKQMLSKWSANAPNSRSKPKPKNTSLNGFNKSEGTSFEGRAPLRGMSPDEGVDYRSPPRTKSDNQLQAIPEKTR
jgi:hypothetical protein